MTKNEFDILDRREYLNFKKKYDSDIIVTNCIKVDMSNNNVILNIDETKIKKEREYLAKKFIERFYDNLIIDESFRKKIELKRMAYINLYDLVREEYKATILTNYVINGEMLTCNAVYLATQFVNNYRCSYLYEIEMLKDLEKVTLAKLDKYVTINYLVGRITYYFLRNIEEKEIMNRVRILRKQKEQ